MSCESCNREFHALCIVPELDRRPPEGWVCLECAPAANDSEMLKTSNIDIPVKRKRGRPRKIKVPLESPPTDGECESSSGPEQLLLSAETNRYYMGTSNAKRRKLKKCPVSGCNGQGHVTGRFEMHHTISGCPKYHQSHQGEYKVIIVVKF